MNFGMTTGDYLVVFGGLATACGTAFRAWFNNQITITKMQSSIATLKENHDEYKESLNKIFSKLDTIESKLSAKADRSGN